MLIVRNSVRYRLRFTRQLAAPVAGQIKHPNCPRMAMLTLTGHTTFMIRPMRPTLVPANYRIVERLQVQLVIFDFTVLLPVQSHRLQRKAK